MSRVLPDTPFMDSVIAKHGSSYLFSKYFDSNMNVKEDAPKELKREAELLRNLDKE